MNLRDDVRECPATYLLSASWVAVYLAMLAVQGGARLGGFLDFGGISPSVTTLFGDLTWRDFARGEVWRVLTASFIHFSATHLAMNLIGMIGLGRLMEPWYGGRPFLAICLGLGAAGNLLGVLMRQGVALGRAWLQAHGLARALPAALAGGAPGADIHAGGGSTVLLGLVGLGLVVGWRSGTRVGAFLRDQMVRVLAITALLGVVLMARIDNYGHAGGAIAGAALGFFHARLVRLAPAGSGRRAAAWASALVVVGCIAAQAYAARGAVAEARRLVAAREAAERLRLIDEALFPSLDALQKFLGPVAYDRAIAVLDEATRRGDPTLIGDLDTSSALVVLALIGTPVDRPPAQRFAEAQGLRRTLDTLDALAKPLGPEIADDAYREAIAIGRDLLAGPVPSRSLYALRVDMESVVRRARRASQEWRAKKEALAAPPAH